MAETEKKGFGLHLTIAIIAGAFALIGLVLFLLGFSTNYYTFGGMNSVLITVLIVLAMAAIAASAALIHKFPDKIWAKLMPLAAVGLLAAASMLIVGDRVEGIGNCIITDYDSGHGGEQAIYMSLVGAVSLIVSIIYIIIGLFHENITQPAPRAKTLGFSIAGGVLAVSAIVATLGLVGVNLTGGTSIGPGGVSSGEMASGTYTVSFNGNSGNVDLVQDTQFIPANVKGLLNADTRLFLDFTLTLDGAGRYTLFADNYVVEGGKRAEIGDDTGLGLILTTTAEGTYVDNGDGTVTTAPATHVVAVMETDTYSSQMKSPAKMKVGDNDADGTYDSNDYPEVLELVPETVWTLSGSEIIGYSVPSDEEPADEQPAEDTPAAPAPEGVTIVSDDGGTAITFNPDGTFSFDFDAYSVHEEGTYTYEEGVLTVTNPNGDSFTAEGDPMALHYVTAVSEQLAGDYTIPAAAFDFAPASEGGFDAFTVVSDDGGTKLTVNPDGTYVFAFESYGIEDPGTWSTVDGKTVFVNANGLEMALEGGKLHYVSGVSEQLTGDFTFEMPASGGAAAEPYTVPSDDGATTITFNGDGTYMFEFASYGVQDAGTYAFDGATLTVINSTGLEMTTSDGKLHYISGVSEQLTGDFTLDLSKL